MTASPEIVASIFGAPVENVRRQYARNAAQLRDMARMSGNGKYRGKTRAEWTELALVAEDKAR